MLCIATVPAAADEDLGSDWVIDYIEARQEIPDTDTVVNLQPGGTPFFLGDRDSILRLAICNIHATDAAANVQLTLASTDPIFTQIRSLVDNTPTTPAAAIPAGGSCADFDWRVSLANTGAIGRHPLTFTIAYERPAATPGTAAGGFQLHVSSIFDNTGTPDVHVMPTLDRVGPLRFLAPDTAQHGTIDLVNYSPGDVADLNVTLTSLPAGVTTAAGFPWAVDPSVPSANTATLDWRLNVPALPPAQHAVAFQATYKRAPGTLDERAITETGLTTTLATDITPILGATLTSPLAVTTPGRVNVPVTFRNDGNARLADVEIRAVSPGIGAPFRLVREHIEFSQATSSGVVTRPSLAPGQTATATVPIDFPAGFQPGKTRLLFRWTALAYNDGTNGDASEWKRIITAPWDHDFDGSTPATWSTGVDLGDDGVIDLYIDTNGPGPHVDLALQPTLAFTTSDFTGVIPVGQDAVSVTMQATLNNPSRSSFFDLAMTVPAGPTQPFFYPGDRTRTTIPVTFSPTSVGAVSGVSFSFIFDVNEEWFRTHANPYGSYEVPLSLDATNELGLVHSGLTVPFRFQTRGLGPNPVVEDLSNEPFLPGGNFDLSFKVANRGDETARAVRVSVFRTSGDFYAREITQTVQAIPAGGTVDFTFPMTASPTASAFGLFTATVTVSHVTPQGSQLSNSIEAPIVMGLAVDPGRLSATALTLAGNGPSQGVRLEARLHNGHPVALPDVLAQLAVGPDAPFLAPGAPTATRVNATSPVSLPANSAGGTQVFFLVDLNPAWWAAHKPLPSFFDGAVLLAGTNPVTGTPYADVALELPVPLSGVGPKLVLVSNRALPETFLAGKPFQLQLTLRNAGDAIARDVSVTVTPIGTSRFTEAIASTGRDTALNISDLGLGSFADLVAADLYLRAVLGSPMPVTPVALISTLAPGESTTLTFDMLAEANTVPGLGYPETVIWSVPGFGGAGGVATIVVRSGNASVTGAPGTPEAVGGIAGGFTSPPATLLLGLAVIAAAALVVRRR